MPLSTDDMVAAFRAIYAIPLGDIYRSYESDSFYARIQSSNDRIQIPVTTLMGYATGITDITRANPPGSYAYLKAGQDCSPLVAPDPYGWSYPEITFDEEWV